MTTRNLVPVTCTDILASRGKAKTPPAGYEDQE